MNTHATSTSTPTPLTRGVLLRRSLWFHRRSHVAVVMGIAVAGAALTGALLVGDSLRASLRDVALGRLGHVDQAVQATGFFGADLAARMAAHRAYPDAYEPPAPVILLAAGVSHPQARTRAGRVQLLGVDERFWTLAGEHQQAPPDGTSEGLVLNAALAEELKAGAGDDVLLRVGTSAEISPETVLGRRDQDVMSRRLTVRAVIPGEGAGRFGLDHTHPAPRNAYLPLRDLQRLLGREGQVNALLFGPEAADASVAGELQKALHESLALEDVGLRLRSDDQRGYLALESAAFLIEPAVEQAAREAAEDLRVRAGSLLTYLANAITLIQDGSVEDDTDAPVSPSIPYSVVTALDDAALPPGRPSGLISSGSAVGVPDAGGSGDFAASPPNSNAPAGAASSPPNPDVPPGPASSPPNADAAEGYAASPANIANDADLTDPHVAEGFAAHPPGLDTINGTFVSPLGPGEIILNEWATRDLGARPGDTIALSYYVAGDFGSLHTASARFTLAAIAPLAGAAADPGFTPPYPGVTDTQRMSDWDPPFPIDLGRVRPQDEQYWEEHRTTPKAFIHLSDGLRLWAGEHAERFGRLTGLRVFPPEGVDLAMFRPRYERALLERLEPDLIGLLIRDVRGEALTAAAGDTDFGGLFIGFSLFVIAAAALLVVLLLRLGIERRSGEVGMMLAAGFGRRQVHGLLLAEGLLLAGIGTAAGLAGSAAYAWTMLAGLRSWWSGAVHAPFLRLHLTTGSLLIGAAATFIVAMVAVAVALRGLTRHSPRILLAGGCDLHVLTSRAPGALSWWVVRILPVLALLSVAAGLARLISAPAAFFMCGALLLVCALTGIQRVLHRPPAGGILRPGALAALRLGARNVPRHPGRSMLIVALLASATFVIAALQAFRIDPAQMDSTAGGPAGGYRLMAESTAPILFDLNTQAGGQAAGLSDQDRAELAGATIIPLRLRPGDDTGCTNLYRSTRLRIAGASPAMIERGGFPFAGQLSHAPNPWSLLQQTLPDGSIPAIGDAASVKWQLHSGLGEELVVQDDRGQDVRLRFVALLSGSVLQDEIIISEAHFARLFPMRSGYSFFLIDAPADRTAATAALLEERLERYGLDVFTSADRLAGYLAVQNTYLTTFQTLGGLGLILGTFGLAAVLLRNIWERRSELALMRAVGFNRRSLVWMVLSENAILVLTGVTTGVLCAAPAVAPHLLERSAVPWTSLATVLAGVITAGLLSGAIALIPMLRAPLLPALRKE